MRLRCGRSWLLRLFLIGTSFALTSCGDSDKDAGPVRTYGLGERVTVGHIVYSVFETQWLYQIGQMPDARIPTHRFFLVRLSAVNGGGGELTVPSLSVVDDNGTSYPELSDGTGVPQYIGFLRRVRPAESVQGNALFDAPPRHYKLRVTDEDGERAALVDIPLSFTSESPDMPPIGDRKK